jgi:uncharacterized HhH-GPD family protein
MSEPEFLNRLCHETGCGLLLDIHNVYANERNHGFDAREFVSRLDPSIIVELHIAGDPEADQLLVDEPLALLIGFVLDQQVPLQKAFSGPLELRRRIGELDAQKIASMDPNRLDEIFRERPALHRFPGNMARRTRELAEYIVEQYGGDAGRVWTEARDGGDLHARLLELPGIGPMKAGTLVSILGKRLGIAPAGWEAYAPHHMTLGDVDSAQALATYQAGKRAYKAEQRAQGKKV